MQKSKGTTQRPPFDVEHVESDAGASADIISSDKSQIQHDQETQILFDPSRLDRLVPSYDALAQTHVTAPPFPLTDVCTRTDSPRTPRKPVGVNRESSPLPYLRNCYSPMIYSSQSDKHSSGFPNVAPPSWSSSNIIEPGDSKFSLFRNSHVDMTNALEQCKKKVIKPFDFLLMVVGWRPLGYNIQEEPSKCRLFCNVLFMVILLFFCIFSYSRQYVMCHWKADMYEVGQATANAIKSSVFTLFQLTNLTMTNQEKSALSLNSHENQTWSPYTCTHLFSVYFIPNVLHLVAYLLGIYHFRWSSHEGVHALMEKVFHSTSAQSQNRIQKVLVRRLRFYFLSGALWILSGIVSHVLHYLAFYVPLNGALFGKKICIGYIGLAMDLTGHIITNFVTTSIIINYILTSDLIIFYVNSVREKLSMRSMEVSAAIHEVLSIKQSVNQLNGLIGIMQSCILARQAQLAIMGCILLMIETSASCTVMAYRILFVLHLLPVLIYPIIQAARVSTACSKIKKNAITMTTYGYTEGTQQSELDSFLLLTMAVKFPVKIFNVPMKSSYLMLVLVGTFFICIILAMAGYLGNTSF